MQRNSVFYILGFCALVCLLCSVVVSSAAVGLKPKQDANKVLDRQKKVLAVAGLMKEGEEIHITYKEPNARRDIMAMVKRRDYNLVNEEEKVIILAK